MIKTAARGIAAAALLSIAVPVASLNAQEAYPTRPIQMILPAPPSGGTDVLGRKMAELLEPILGQKVVAENRPGAGGTLGIAQMLAARPDGYTIATVWNGPLASTPHTLELTYTLDQIKPLFQIGASSYVMCVQPSFPANTGQELLDHLKANPNKYTYGNDGIGNTMQFAAERIFAKIGTKVRAVPFAGAGETARNFLGGHIDIYGGGLVAIQPHMTAGKAKCLIVTSADDNPTMPQAQGLAKLGMADQETVLWWALIASAKVPADRLAKLEAAFRKAAESAEFKAVLAKVGAQSVFRGSAELAPYLKGEYDALAAVAKTIGLERKKQ